MIKGFGGGGGCNWWRCNKGFFYGKFGCCSDGFGVYCGIIGGLV